MAGLFPSMPKAQMPSPAMWNVLASWAFSARDVGLSKYVSCHWVPTWYEVHGGLGGRVPVGRVPRRRDHAVAERGLRAGGLGAARPVVVGQS